jgi:NAD(P)H-flavin reductase
VLANRNETSDTSTLVLEQVTGGGMALAPGQFAMIYAYGVGEAPISVSGASSASGTTHTVRDVGAVTHAIGRAKPDSVLGLRGPFGVGWPLGEAIDRDVVVIAGGLGMAPLRPVINRILADRSWYRRVSLLYGARTPDDRLYRDELASWTREGQIAVELTVDSAETEWTGRVGVVPKLLSGAEFDPNGCVAFVCGPEIMMRFSAAALLDAGVPGERIYVSLERHMECGVGLCGHCQLGPTLICRDGPVYRYSDVAPWLFVKEL